MRFIVCYAPPVARSATRCATKTDFTTSFCAAVYRRELRWVSLRPEIEAASGKVAGVGFGICFSPEFLREGSAVR